MKTLAYLRDRFAHLPKTKKFLVIATFVLLLVVSGWAGFLVGSTKPVVVESPKKEEAKKVEEPKKIAHPITGIEYLESEVAVWKDRVPMAVMVENSTSARPQKGLSKADIVYEALAEGDITRFVAVFSTNSTQVGPVRSAREYYFDWASEYKAAYAHWGGNQYVRNLASQTFGAKDLDQFAIGSAAFYRLPPNCRSEHCGFSHTDKLWEVASKRGVNSAVTFESWKFKKDQPVNPPTHPTASIGLKGAYAVRWDYDSATNSYKRVNGGVAHTDSEHNNAQITVKNIIVQFLNYSGMKQVTPGVFNRDVQTTGSGTAKVFRDGTIIEGTWKKDSRDSRTKLFDTAGKEIEFNRGQIWVEMVPTATPV